MIRTGRLGMLIALAALLVISSAAAAQAAPPTPTPTSPVTSPAPVPPAARSGLAAPACPDRLAKGTAPLTAQKSASADLHSPATICIRRINDPRARASLRRLSTAATREQRAKVLAHPNSAGSVPVAFPSWCPITGAVEYHLTDVCQIQSYELVIVNKNTGAVEGTLDYNVLEYAYWELNLLSIINQVELDPYNSSGVGNVGWTTLSADGYCSLTEPGAGKSCTRSEYHFPSGAAFYAPPDWPTTTDHIGGWAAIDTNYTSGTESRLWTQVQWGLWYTGPVPIQGPTAFWANDAFLTYCDNNFPGDTHGGCKAPTDFYTPILTYRLATYPQLAKAIQLAQAKGVPGSAASGTYLLRTTSAAIVNANRSWACPTNWTRPTGYECDEYPFASTYEGAAYNPHSGITFSFCKNTHLSQTTANPKWESCFVPKAQNSSAGGALGAFWSANRTLDNDRFHVNVTA